MSSNFIFKEVETIKKFPAEDGSKWSKKLLVIKMGEPGSVKRYLSYGRYYDDGYRGLINMDKDAVKEIFNNKEKIEKLLSEKD